MSAFLKNRLKFDARECNLAKAEAPVTRHPPGLLPFQEAAAASRCGPEPIVGSRV